MRVRAAEYPRVLFVTPHAFNKVTGGGITFTNLFRGWPADCIATVHDDPEPTEGEVCTRYFELGRAELNYAQPFALARDLLRPAGGRDGGPTGPTARPPGAGHDDVSNQTAEGAGMLARAASLGLSVLGGALPARGRLTPRLESWIGEYRPQVLYTILGSNGMMDLIEAIRARFDLPMVVHIMDDWMSARHRTGLLGPFLCSGMRRRVDHAMRAANARLSISDAMSEAFAVRYGAPFEAFQNTMDLDACRSFARTRPEAGRPADILYVGSIFPDAQLEALVDCCHAVARLNATFPARLTISSPSGHAARHAARLQVDPAVRIIDTIRDDVAFFKRIAAADLLLLPVNFDPETVRFIRYSMPTKVPAYLAAGAPILAYGPAETAQMRYAQADGWAFTLTTPGVDGLVDALRDALENVEARGAVMAAARAAAARNHDAAAVRARFQARLIAAASRKSMEPTS